MLSIGAMQGGQAEYYLKLAQEDYYLAGGEPPGTWQGRGAEVLGLTDQVEAEQLRACFTGYSPQGKQLVQNAGKEDRQPGWDLTFSAPKSVSVLWSQADSAGQQAIAAAHQAATVAALKYLEADYAYSRVGRGGTERVQAGLVIATFEHSTSRALDPQLHTHALVMNLGVDAQGKTRTILSKPFYQAKMLAGAYYRCELASQLQARLGLETYRPEGRGGQLKSWFEVQNVSSKVMEHFSKRRAEILKELGSRGMESASAAAFATLATREAKDVVPPRSELLERWKQEGTELGYQGPKMSPQQVKDVETTHRLYRQALAEAIDTITFSENYFTPAELTRRTLEAAQVYGIEAASVVEAVAIDLTQKPHFVSLGMRNGKQLFTTPEILSLEKEFLQAAQQVHARPFRAVKEKFVAAALAKERGQPGKTFQLDEEQQQAVRYITQGSESLKVITGLAGTGKTDMLAAAREALEQGGYQVIGTSLAGVAARGLEEKTGIQSETVRLRELQLYRGIKHQVKHHAQQLARAALGKQTFKLEKLKIDAKTVLVIDEAGMVGTRDFALLAKAVAEQGGSIVAVGDQWQLPSIERGGCLGTLAKHVDGCHLSVIRRQKADERDRTAVEDLVAGNPAAALIHYAKKGQFTVSKNVADSERQLISDWVRAGGVEAPTEHKIYASTHAEVDRYNELAQGERAQAGHVDASRAVEHDGRRFMVGDRVRFSKSERKLGIKKAETGEVIAVRSGFTGKYLVVKTTAEEITLTRRAATAALHHAKQLINQALGKQTQKLARRSDVILVPLKSVNPLATTYDGLQLSYCETVHASQGQTVRNAYIHLGGNMTDRELTYVQGSRHEEALRLYAEELEAGAALSELARSYQVSSDNLLKSELPDYSTLTRQMANSRAKEFASAIVPERDQQELSLQIER